MRNTLCWRGVDRDAVANYVLGRQTRSGGFSFYAYEDWGVDEPHVPDTYAALAILRILDIPVPHRQACQAWLLNEQDRAGGYPMLVIAHAAFKALQLLGCRPLYDPRDYLQKSAQGFGLVGSMRLTLAGKTATIVQCLELWRAFDMPISEDVTRAVRDALARLRSPDGGYGTPGASVVETVAAMDLGGLVGLSPDCQVLGFVQRCERQPFGIDLTPASVSSSLECLHAGLRILSRFGVAPRHPEEIRCYVSSCQNDTGGFGRAPGAIARLDDTLRAVEISLMLQGCYHPHPE